MSPVVVLVGAPGSGKSTVGARLARRLGVELRDTDADVETRTGHTVAELFVDRGEAVFRDLEERAVATALDEHDGVLALGGGAVLRASTRDRLAGHPVAWLDVGLTHAASRVGLGVARPLLLGNVRGQLHTLLAQRRPAYEQVATWTVRTDGRTPDEVTDEVWACLAEDAHR